MKNPYKLINHIPHMTYDSDNFVEFDKDRIVTEKVFSEGMLYLQIEYKTEIPLRFFRAKYPCAHIRVMFEHTDLSSIRSEHPDIVSFQSVDGTYLGICNCCQLRVEIQNETSNGIS